MSEARGEILRRIRHAAGDRAPDHAADYLSISQDFQHSGKLSGSERVELFRDRLQDYGCDVQSVAQSEIAAAIDHALQARGKKRLLLPSALPPEWLPDGFDFILDLDLANAVIESAEGVITGCALAIAQTGTLVLRHSSGEGRRVLTLIPDYHLCVVLEHQIVETVPEGIGKMAEFATTPITTISGPSATSDIEMTRIKGVHGPRVLDVLLVRCDLPSAP